MTLYSEICYWKPYNPLVATSKIIFNIKTITILISGAIYNKNYYYYLEKPKVTKVKLQQQNNLMKMYNNSKSFFYNNNHKKKLKIYMEQKNDLKN